MEESFVFVFAGGLFVDVEVDLVVGFELVGFLGVGGEFVVVAFVEEGLGLFHDEQLHFEFVCDLLAEVFRVDLQVRVHHAKLIRGQQTVDPLVGLRN